MRIRLLYKQIYFPFNENAEHTISTNNKRAQNLYGFHNSNFIILLEDKSSYLRTNTKK